MAALAAALAARCQAIVEDYERPAYRASMQRITAPSHRRCKRAANEPVEHLSLCSPHARLCRDGLIDRDGTVAPRPSIADVRRYPSKFPRGLYDWMPTR